MNEMLNNGESIELELIFFLKLLRNFFVRFDSQLFRHRFRVNFAHNLNYLHFIVFEAASATSAAAIIIIENCFDQ